jgi:hypothetical protein
MLMRLALVTGMLMFVLLGAIPMFVLVRVSVLMRVAVF